MPMIILQIPRRPRPICHVNIQGLGENKQTLWHNQVFWKSRDSHRHVNILVNRISSVLYINLCPACYKVLFHDELLYTNEFPQLSQIPSATNTLSTTCQQ